MKGNWKEPTFDDLQRACLVLFKKLFQHKKRDFLVELRFAHFQVD